GFVHFDVSAHLVKRTALNRQSEPVHHEPRGFLGDAKIAGDLVAADAVLAVDEHPHRGQPLRERDRAVLEDAADLDGELLPATLALPDAPGGHVGALLALTVRAFDTAWPAQTRDE